MKAYQSVVWDVKNFFTTDGGIMVLVLSAIFVIGGLGARWDARDARVSADNIAWCLDQGGRRVVIDSIRDCFQLTEVLLESETFEEQGRECTRVPTQAYIKAAGGNLYFCYEFKRVNREN